MKSLHFRLAAVGLFKKNLGCCLHPIYRKPAPGTTVAATLKMPQKLDSPPDQSFFIYGLMLFVLSLSSYNWRDEASPMIQL
jgi:hypothetical protein